MREEEIIEIENKLIDGIKTSDIELLDKILHDDLLFIAPNGQTVTKEMDLASHRSGEMEVEQLIANFEDIKIIGDNAIVVVVYVYKNFYGTLCPDCGNTNVVVYGFGKKVINRYESSRLKV